jgi:5-methylcytosine-specific restriction endonuclease McrA
MPHKDPEVRKAYLKAYRKKHSARIVQKVAAWRKANPEKAKGLRHRYAEQHKQEERERCRTKAAKQRQEQPEKIKAIGARWRKAHPEYGKARYARDPEGYRARQIRYSARKRGAEISNFTAEQWKRMQDLYKHRCAYCGKRAKGHLTQDHITPLSKGGNHTASNIIPACASCNSKKYTGLPLKSIQPILLL